MSKKHRPPTVTDPGPRDQLPPEVGSDRGEPNALDKARDRDAVEIFSRMRRELGSSGFVTLRRSHPATGQTKPGYIGEMEISQFSIENVTNLYGGGDFIAQGRPANGQIAAEHRFTIDHTIPPKNPRSGVKEEKQPSTDVASIIRELHNAMPKADNTGLVEIVKAALARPEPKSEIIALTEMIKELREESRRSEDRFMKLFERLNENRAEPGDPLAQLDRVFEIADRVAEIRGNGTKGEGDTWKEKIVDVLKDAIPIVAKNFGQVMPPQPGAVAALPAAPIRVPALPVNQPAAAATKETPVAAAAGAEDMNATLNFALNRFRSMAMDAARKGKDAWEWVDSMIGFIPDNFHGEIYKLANAEDWFNRIFGADPEATKYLEFLTSVRESILARAFIAHVRTFAAAQKTSDDTVKLFLAWVHSSFHDALFAMADDSESWAEAFRDTGLDADWLERVRKEILSSLDGEKVVDLSPADAPAAPASGSAETGAAAATPAPAATVPTPKRSSKAR